MILTRIYASFGKNFERQSRQSRPGFEPGTSGLLVTEPLEYLWGNIILDSKDIYVTKKNKRILTLSSYLKLDPVHHYKDNTSWTIKKYKALLFFKYFSFKNPHKVLLLDSYCYYYYYITLWVFVFTKCNAKIKEIGQLYHSYLSIEIT